MSVSAPDQNQSARASIDQRRLDEILIITDRRFWRRSIGSEQRVSNLLGHLARRAERDDRRVVAVYVGRATRSDHAGMNDFVSATPGLEIVTRHADAAFLWHGLQNSLRRLGRFGRPGVRPALGSNSAALRESPLRRTFVQSIIESRRPRIVIVEFLRLTYTVFPRPKAGGASPVYWIDTHDALHRRAERYRKAGRRIANEIDAQEEMRQLDSYDAILAIQRPEAELFRRRLPGKPIAVVAHGLPLPELHEASPTAGSPVRLGFLGGRDESNRVALDWFVAKIWPDLRSKFGTKVELHVAGQVCRGWPSRNVGIIRIGEIESIDQFWPNLEIAINPIRFGSGLKIKNVEALAYGLPLLTTSIGAEGLDGASPHGLRIADAIEDWNQTLCDWISDPIEARAVARAGRAYAEEHLSEAAAFADLDHKIAGVFVESRA